MAQQMDPNQLKKAEVSASLAKSLISQAIEQSAANPLLCEEALKQASAEIAQAQTMISQVQSTLQASSQQ
ncbi:hypothetical protein SAMN04487897_104113 [Paenibacillus sp. yr247]|uniref:hypothetical protein n=1 Tax=Paenibacillus sp. yr247 TaxID=1761880 RepID=UPI0008814119|nr:hypothetical protein [Paenibacillus sp. yr247]SDN69551.1 hypothetical protein SAMN04487897_104113 [Paenibacillus sp. yr247]